MYIYANLPFASQKKKILMPDTEALPCLCSLMAFSHSALYDGQNADVIGFFFDVVAVKDSPAK